jgi:hypothetical protein
MPRDYHASPQLPSAHPDEGTLRRRDVWVIEVIDECLGIELPYLTARLDRLPPPENLQSDGLQKGRDHT